MLQSRSLKSFVVLVVFCFSLVAVCISPVWADTTSGDPDSFAVYAGIPTTDPPYQSNPAVVPFSGHHVFYTWSPQGTIDSIPVIIDIPEIIPTSYSRTLVLDVGFSGFPRIVPAAYNRFSDVFYTRSSFEQLTLSGGCVNVTDNRLTTAHGYTVTHQITIPSNATTLSTKSSVDFRIYGDKSEIAVVSYGGYVVDSSDRNLVDIVSNILSRVKSIDGNVSSSLASLNRILVECQSIKADTSTIASILQLVSDNIVALNGKVDDIYTLLKDSLKNESAAVDQKSEKLGGEIMQRVDSEQYWSDKNTENFNALDMGNWTFGDGVVGALPTVGNLFKSLWDSIGDVTLIFVFPLMLGIALVIVGRLSRTAGKGSKKGGGDDG